MLKDITKGCGVVGILVGSYSMLEGLLPGLLLSIEEGGVGCVLKIYVWGLRGRKFLSMLVQLVDELCFNLCQANSRKSLWATEPAKHSVKPATCKCVYSYATC